MFLAASLALARSGQLKLFKIVPDNSVAAVRNSVAAVRLALPGLVTFVRQLLRKFNWHSAPPLLF